MRCASLTLSRDSLADSHWLRPVAQLVQAVRALPADDASGHASRDTPRLPAGGGGGRILLRRVMIAAAIASGLIALWVAMLPLVA